MRGFLDSVATLVGPLLAAVLLKFTDVEVVFAVVSAASLAAAALLLRLRYDAPPRPAAPRGVHLLAEAAEGIRAIVRNRDLALLNGLAIAQTFTRRALTVFTVVVALDLLRIGEPGCGNSHRCDRSECGARFSHRITADEIAAARSVVWHRHCVVGATNRAYPAFSSTVNDVRFAGMRWIC